VENVVLNLLSSLLEFLFALIFDQPQNILQHADLCIKELTLTIFEAAESGRLQSNLFLPLEHFVHHVMTLTIFADEIESRQNKSLEGLVSLVDNPGVEVSERADDDLHAVDLRINLTFVEHAQIQLEELVAVAGRRRQQGEELLDFKVQLCQHGLISMANQGEERVENIHCDGVAQFSLRQIVLQLVEDG
jgi:hypothetical protein